MIEVPGVPHVHEVRVRVRVEDGIDVLIITYIPGLTLGATFIGNVRKVTEGFQAFPFLWGTWGVDPAAMTLHPSIEAAIDWLVDAAEAARQATLLSAAADHAQGGTDA